MNDNRLIGGIIVAVVIIIGGAAYFILRPTAASPVPEPSKTIAQTLSTQPTPRRPTSVALASLPTPAASEEVMRLRAENERLKQQLDAHQTKVTATPVPAPPPARISVTGSAWLTKVGGESDVLRGLRVHLLPAEMPHDLIVAVLKTNIAQWNKSQSDAEASIKNSYDEGSKKIAQDVYGPGIAEAKAGAAKAAAAIGTVPPSVDVLVSYQFLCQTAQFGLPSFNNAVSAMAISEVKTDVNGKYNMPNVTPGKYYLQAEIDGGGHFIEWLIPVVAAGDNLSIDIENGSAVHIDNVK